MLIDKSKILQYDKSFFGKKTLPSDETAFIFSFHKEHNHNLQTDEKRRKKRREWHEVITSNVKP